MFPNFLYMKIFLNNTILNILLISFQFIIPIKKIKILLFYKRKNMQTCNQFIVYII